MMVIRVVIDVKPGLNAALEEHLRTESEQVRQMDGCLGYDLFQSTDYAACYLPYEEWASADAFAVYRSSELLKQSYAPLGPMLAGPPDSQYFEASPAV
ncbi:MAG: quinol monooxygenase YgiN [Myxococcota bacterium]|jgi:quinol monooxygenase YgiN